MKFREITEEEYRKFWEKSKQKCFLNAPEIGHLNEKNKMYFFAVEKGGEIISAIMVRGAKRRFSKYDFYAPRGILSEDKKVREFLIKNLKETVKEKNGYIFRIDPNIELIERDIDGKEVNGGIDNRELVKDLKNLGFHKSDFIKDVSQVTWEFILPISGKSEDDILKNMKSSTRRCLKQALELGVEIKDLDEENLDAFYEILAGTADRKKFDIRDFNYYKKLYELFKPRDEVQFTVETINPKKSLKKLKEKIKTEKEDTSKKQQERENKIKSLEKCVEKLKEKFPEMEDKDTVLSSGVFMTMSPEILYFFGGNDGKYMNLNGQYALQWEMIKRAIKKGYERYNFYGIPANLEMGTNERGVYDFKRGFSGRCVELIGEWELPLSGYYTVNKTISRLKRAVRK